jgi:hypothetical protein
MHISLRLSNTGKNGLCRKAIQWLPLIIPSADLLLPRKTAWVVTGAIALLLNKIKQGKSQQQRPLLLPRYL